MGTNQSKGRAVLISGVQLAMLPLVLGLAVGGIWAGVHLLNEAAWLSALMFLTCPLLVYGVLKATYDGSLVRSGGRVRLLGDWYPQGSVVRVTSSPGPVSAAPLPGAYPVVVVRDADGVEQEVGLPAHGYYMPFDRWFLPGKLEQTRRVVGIAWHHAR